MKIPTPPPLLSDLPAGTTLTVGMGVSVVTATFDFETYSPAGFVWDPHTNSFKAPQGANVKGLPAVGAAVYTEHADAEVLSLSYDLKKGDGIEHWLPLTASPVELFKHLYEGGLLEAWNVSFEVWVWENICVPSYNWPSLAPYYPQLRCAMAKARAFGLPGSLEMAGNILNTTVKKDTDGKRLLNKFSVPQNPSKKQPQTRFRPCDDFIDFQKLREYNDRDVKAESEASSKIPDLSDFELAFWQCDQKINRRGIQIDIDSVNATIAVIEQAHTQYNHELSQITHGMVRSASTVKQLQTWVEQQTGTTLSNLDAEVIHGLLLDAKVNELPTPVVRALQIRELLSSAAVKKLYAMRRMLTKKGRLHDCFLYYGARTGRATGAGAQPQNMPNHGPEVNLCDCGKYSKSSYDFIGPRCTFCGRAIEPENENIEWSYGATEQAINTLQSRSLKITEYYWNNAIELTSGCLRSMMIAAPGTRLICSDYSAIEAVVLAMVSKEQWRIDVFKTHGKIYEASAARITGARFEDIIAHKKNTGTHHHLRKLGKVAELASGFQGALGAWTRFGAKKYLSTDEEILTAVRAWRAASPNVVNLWYGLEKAAKTAIRNPRTWQSYNNIHYFVMGTILYCKLPSGRMLVYHDIKLQADSGSYNNEKIVFHGWNTNPDNGPTGWTQMSTYGGKLTENVVQAIARDILAYAIVNLENAGYPVVIHVHDEIVAEVPIGAGSLLEFELIMSTMPGWAHDWPIKAQGGWEGQRYRK